MCQALFLAQGSTRGTQEVKSPVPWNVHADEDSLSVITTVRKTFPQLKKVSVRIFSSVNYMAVTSAYFPSGLWIFVL